MFKKKKKNYTDVLPAFWINIPALCFRVNGNVRKNTFYNFFFTLIEFKNENLYLKDIKITLPFTLIN